MCSDIQVKDLNSNDGIEILKTNLKLLLAKDINQAAFLAYDKLESLDMELPTGVLGYMLLKIVCLSKDKQQLARGTVPSLTYECSY